MKGIVFFAVIVAAAYIIWDLKKTSKEIGKKEAMANFGVAMEGIRNAGLKEYLWGFGAFVAVFFLARGAMIWQNTAQECEVWENAEIKQEFDFELLEEHKRVYHV